MAISLLLFLWVNKAPKYYRIISETESSQESEKERNIETIVTVRQRERDRKRDLVGREVEVR